MRIRLIPRRADDTDRAHTRVRADYITDYLAAIARGNHIDAAHIRHLAEKYAPDLADELDAIGTIPAAA
jgi:hypothetical protein